MKRKSEGPFSQADELIGPIEVNLDIFLRQDHVDLVIAYVASVLCFDDAVMEFPKSFVALGKFVSECGDYCRMLGKAQPAAEQKCLRRVEQSIVGTRYSEVEVAVSGKAPGCGQTPARFGQERSLIGVHRTTPSARMF